MKYSDNFPENCLIFLKIKFNFRLVLFIFCQFSQFSSIITTIRLKINRPTIPKKQNYLHLKWLWNILERKCRLWRIPGRIVKGKNLRNISWIGCAGALLSSQCWTIPTDEQRKLLPSLPRIQKYNQSIFLTGQTFWLHLHSWLHSRSCKLPR